jgi:hypothetical protein
VADSDHDLLIRIDERIEKMHKELLGNGRPGRMELVEGRVTDLEAGRNRALGWIGGAGAVLAAAWGALEWVFHRKP